MKTIIVTERNRIPQNSSPSSRNRPWFDDGFKKIIRREKVALKKLKKKHPPNILAINKIEEKSIKQ